MGQTVRLFRMDVSRFPVTFADVDGQRVATGLPLMRPGTWNGETYTEQDLAGIADAFGTIRDSDAFTPAVKPYHTYGSDGKPLPFDARQTLGRWTGLRFDSDRQALLGDAVVLDPSFEDGVTSGKLQYLSAELWPNLRVAATGETVALAFVGAAFVDHPGVKGMPWEVIVNSADFPVQRKGADRMSTWDAVKALFRKVGASEDDVAALDALDPGTEGGGTVQTNDAKPEPSAALPETVRRQIEMLQAQVEDQGKALAEQAEQARMDRAQTFAESLCAEGYVPPAQKARLFAVAERVLCDTTPVRVLSAAADGQTVTEEKTVIELLGDLIRNAGKRVQTSPRGLSFDGTVDPDEPQIMDSEQIEKLVKSVGGGN